MILLAGYQNEYFVVTEFFLSFLLPFICILANDQPEYYCKTHRGAMAHVEDLTMDFLTTPCFMNSDANCVFAATHCL
jgi:hypothetical protein